MKKVLSLIAVSALLMVAVACNSVESKTKGYLKDMEKALKAGDTEKVEKISNEMDEWVESLSEEDQTKAATVALQYLAEHPELMGAM